MGGGIPSRVERLLSVASSSASVMVQQFRCLGRAASDREDPHQSPIRIKAGVPPARERRLSP